LPEEGKLETCRHPSVRRLEVSESTMIGKPAPARKGRLAFLGLLLLEIAFLVGMALCRRIPAYHDGFGHLGLQYYFLNSAITSGEVPQWIPYMTQGTVANWWYAIQGNLLLNVLAFLGPATAALEPLNFLPLFYAGIACDMLLLLVGTWLLARRFFRSTAAVFFTAVAVVGPCIWMDQPWFNFHFFYAIPLLLVLLHRFLDQGSWWSLLLALNLLALQTIGNLPYFIPMTALVLALYFGLYGLFNRRTTLEALRRLRWGWPFAVTLVLSVGGLMAAQLILQAGTEEIAYYNPGRGLDARVGLDNFLNYGGHVTVWKWAEMALGVSPSLDNTLYIGLLAVPLLLAGCCLGVRKQTAHLPILAGVLLLFGLGSFVAAQAYEWWPLMSYYRHIGLTGCLTRLFLCFVAGCGFEAIFAGGEGIAERWTGRAAGVFAAGMVLLAAGLFYLSSRPALAVQVLATTLDAPPPPDQDGTSPDFFGIFDPPVLCSRLFLSAWVALLCSALLAARALLRKPKHRPVLMAATLLLASGDVYLYKSGEVRLRTAALPGSDLSLTAFQHMPYRPRRATSFFAADARADVFQRDLPFPAIRKYWYSNPFAFVDEAGTSFRTDHWLRPLDGLLRAFTGQPGPAKLIAQAVASQGMTPSGAEAPAWPHALAALRIAAIDAFANPYVPPLGCGHSGPMLFPLQSPAARKLGGVDVDKVQFFRTAHFICGEQAIAALMADPHYRGDALFIAAPPGEPGELPDPACLQDDDRLALEYAVERFDSNNLVLTVHNTTGAPVWLVYSDVWHPGWRATVDGQCAFVHRAVLAYKAVQVPAGSSRVHFCFRQGTVSVLYGLFAACSLLWLVVLAGLTIRLCRADARPSSGECEPFRLRRGWEELRRLKCGMRHAGQAQRPAAAPIERVGRERRAEEPCGGTSEGLRGWARAGRLAAPGFALVLLGLLGVVYAPCLDNAPRAYHWDFLLDGMGRHTFLDAFAPGDSYNRTRRAGPGDSELFRPVAFAVPAAEKALFGTHFRFYQAFGILLHWGVACLLLFLLKTVIAWEGPIGGTVESPLSRPARLLPYGVCLFFAFNKSVVPLVVWPHLHGCLLFLFFLLASLTALLRCARQAADWKCPWLWGSWVLALLAARTCELGQVYALLAGLFLAAALPPGTARSRRLAFGGLFAAILVLYQGAGVVDRWVHRGQFDSEDARSRILAGAVSPATWANSKRILAYTTLQPFFPSMWRGSLERGQLRIEEIAWSQSLHSLFRPAFAASALTTALAAGLGLFGLARLLRRPDKRLFLLFLLGAGLYSAYQAAIVLGCLNRRPVAHLSWNGYCAPVGLLLALAPACVAWLAAGRSRAARNGQAALLLGLAALSCYSGSAARRLTAAAAEDLNCCPDGGANFLRRVARLEQFIRLHEGEADFSLGFDFDSCRVFGTHHGVPVTAVLFQRHLRAERPKYVVGFPDGEPAPMTYAEWRQSRGPEGRLCPAVVAVGATYNYFRVDGWYYGVQTWDGCYDPARRDHAYLIRDRTLEGAMQQEPANLAEKGGCYRWAWFVPPEGPLALAGRWQREVEWDSGPRQERLALPWKSAQELCAALHYRRGCFDVQCAEAE
jgi:hypothetical protein